VPDFSLSEAAQQWVNVALIWIGFGTLAGLLAKALIPGREREGAVGTVVIGVLGSVVGLAGLGWLLKRTSFNPISPLGFLAAVGGAFVLLLGYRAATLRWAVEQDDEAD